MTNDGGVLPERQVASDRYLQRAALKVLVEAAVAEPEECRSEAGVTTGLVDALISVCRVLAGRDLTQAREALADLVSDEDVAIVFRAAPIFTQQQAVHDLYAKAIDMHARLGPPDGYNQTWLEEGADIAQDAQALGFTAEEDI